MSGSKRGLLDVMHIPRPGRKGMRERAAKLESRARKLGTRPGIGDELKEVSALLAEAHAALASDAKQTNALRAASLQTAKAKCDAAEAKLGPLETRAASVKDDNVVAFDRTRKPKEDKAQLQAVKDRLAQLRARLATTAPSLGIVMMPPGLGPTELDTRVAKIEQEMGDVPVDAARARVLIASITDVETSLDAALDEANAAVAFLQRVRSIDIPDWEKGPVQKLRTALGPAAEQTPALVKLAALKSAIAPQNRLIFLSRLQEMEVQTAIEMDRVDLDPAYAASEGAKLDKKQRGAAQAAMFETAVGANLQKLRDYAAALGNATFDATIQSAADTQVALMGGEMDDPAAKGAIASATADVSKALVTATQMWGDLAGAVETAKSEIEAEINKLAATRANRLFAVDWKQIDGMCAILDQLAPPDVEVSPAAMTNLVAAKASAAQIKERLVAMTAAAAKADRFRDIDKTLKQQLADEKVAAVSGFFKIDSGIQIWFPAKRKEVNDGLDKLHKELPQLTADAAVKRIEALKKTMDETIKAFDDLNGFIRDTVAPAYHPLRDRYQAAKDAAKSAGNKLPEPNKFSAALDTVKTLANSKPPVQALVQTAMTEMIAAFGTLDQAGIIAEAASSATTMEADTTTKEQKTKGEKGALQARLKTARAGFAAASKADGVDKTTVKEIKRLIGLANDQVKANDAAAARTVERVENQVALLMAHPEGEANRRAKELPKLYNEWLTAVSRANEDLEALVGKLTEWKPTTDVAKSTKLRDALCQKIFNYALTFAEEKPELTRAMQIVWDTGKGDQERRKGREAALAIIADLKRSLQAHPLTAELLKSPFPEAKVAPRLFSGLERLRFTVLTSVPAETP